MIRVTDTVRQIVSEDAFAIEAMQRNLLNFSAYAQEILPRVEKRTMKSVRVGTVIVALSRIAAIMGDQPFSPHVAIDNFSITSNLHAISYVRTHSVNDVLNKGTFNISENHFFTITEGIHEVTVICAEALTEQIKSYFSDKPVSVMEDLVAVSVRFSEKYIHIPNTIYSLVGALALRHINILEIVSTYSELTFVIHKNELDTTIQALQEYNLR